jgi:cysteine-rich repeat protein
MFMRSARLLVTLIGSLVAVGCTQPSSVQCPGGLVCPPGSTCAAHQSVCIKGLCGNGTIDTAAGEVCDDGNIVDGDGCSADCKSNETCGNGIVDTAKGEVCDKGADNASCDGCSPDCKSLETCGNGIVDTCKGEVCDDGNNVSGDGCSADCKSTERCGNGIIDLVDGEVCDKGAADNAKCDGCSPDCRSNETCGNGIVDACKGEVCDKGADNLNCDGCSPDCKSDQTCGNGIVDACKGEVCDLGPLNGKPGAGCSADCKSKQTCGNGVVDVGEQCDPGPDTSNPCGANTACPTETAACNRDCTVAFCGDGKVNHARGEQCDDGVETAHCNANCTLAACGDGILNLVAGEQCDAGNNTMNPNACTATCSTTTDCLSKTCTNDSCTIGCTSTADISNCNGNGAGMASCHTSACGDGHVNTAAGETCDPPGANGADTTSCNGKNAGAVSCHGAVCGDGYVNTAAGEECDTLGGGDTQTCNGKNAGAVACKLSHCGDGYTNAIAGETCDTAGGADTSGCNGKTAGAVACKVPSCGDGYTNTMANETCDTLGGADTSSCNGNSAAARSAGVACKSPSCGDTYANSAAGETCDNGPNDSANCNGNSVAAVTAGVACKAARCGDGYANGAGGEQCDNGSANSNSAACLANCKNATCGDGFVEAGFESCDTGSTTASPTGGCHTCGAPDPGWACTLPSPPGPSSCAPVCGDGDVVTNAATGSKNEVCDDNNVSACGLCKNGNGCNSGSGAAVNTLKAATGTIASNTNTHYTDGQVFTLSDGAHSLTFEFDSNGSVGAGNVPIDIKASATSNAMTCRICQAINGSGLHIQTSGNGCPAASCAGNSFTLTNKTAGAVGNVAITTTVTSSTFTGGLTGMSGGQAEDCVTGVGCTNNDDCASDVCSLDQACPGGAANTCGVCVAPSCVDNKKNGLETDTDCGGGTCGGCAPGKGCVANNDCNSGVCSSTVSSKTGTGTCAAPTCTDNVLNGSETDVDCGGGTCTQTCGTVPATCYQCPDNQACKVNLDCMPPPVGAPVTATTVSGVCDTATPQTCLPAEILQVVVSGGATLASTSPAGTLDTGDITNCTSSGGACVQSYASGASVTLTATATATSGTISWTGATCSTCTLSSTVQTCTCAVTMSSYLKVSVTESP